MSADVSATNESSTPTLSVEQRRQREKHHWWLSTALVPILLLVIPVGIGAVALLLHGRQMPPPDPVPPPDETELIAGEVDANVVGIRLQLQKASFDIGLAQAKQSLRHLESAEQEWSTLLDATLHDSAGRQIAGSDELLLRFIALREMPLPIESKMTASDLAFAVDDLAKNVNMEDADSLRSVAEAFEKASERAVLLFNLRQARTDQLKILRDSAQSLVPSPYKLSMAISRRPATVSSKLEAIAEKVKRDTETMLNEELERLETQHEKAVDLVEQLTAQLKSVQSGEALATTDSDEPAIPLATRQEYRDEFDRIRAVLTAFTTPGYVQPETADKLVFHDTKQPVSYSALERIGALEAKKGLPILFRVGGSKSATQQNDRPLGTFPRMNSISELGNPNIAARVEEAQELLCKYGSFLIEDGLLAP
ncbi:hypothetical protein [Rhodopirellula bahusiensis]|uniref:hypothetical protein n=1 Tax=Rhodopirellula bahusiensis TaxID=2014065 RepID=UPI000C06AC25|nr:hypothetical protein [Rhodopirellula bahusiensis]